MTSTNKRPRPLSAFRLPPSALSAAITVKATNQHRRRSIDTRRLCDAVRVVLVGEGIQKADISLAIVDDRTIHDLNRRFLDHDAPTDVISFALETKAATVDGEIVVSADTAAAAAWQYGWSTDDELLLYVIHGALHLAGYDDVSVHERKTMRQRERLYLAQFGLCPPNEQRTKLKMKSGNAALKQRPTSKPLTKSKART